MITNRRQHTLTKIFLHTLFLGFPFLTKEATAQPRFDNPCTATIQVDTDFAYTVNWTLYAQDGIVNFTVVTDSLGVPGEWVGLGFSLSTEAPFMFPSDVIIGIIPDMGVSPSVSDRYTIAASTPLEDMENNLLFSSISLEDALVTMEFSILIESPDLTNDVAVRIPRYWIWAVGFAMTMPGVGVNIRKHPIGNMNGVFPEQIDIFSCEPELMPTEPTVMPPTVRNNLTTNITQEFIYLNNMAHTLANLTIEDVQILATNLSSLLINAVDIVDQNINNLEIVQHILENTAQYYSSGRRLSSPVTEQSIQTVHKTVVGFIQCLETIEKWPTNIIRGRGSGLTLGLNALIGGLISQDGIGDFSADGESISIQIHQTISLETVTFLSEISEGVDQISSSVVSNSVYIPSNSSLRGSISLTVSNSSWFLWYKNNRLFLPASGYNNSRTVIMDLSVVGTLPFDDTVDIALAIGNPNNMPIESAMCVFWDTEFDEMRGGWSPEGCTHLSMRSTNQHVFCQCNYHLSAFTALVNFADTSSVESSRVSLHLFSCIAIGINLFFLSAIMVTHLLIFLHINVRKINTLIHIFRIQFCLTIFCLSIVLLIGITRTDIRIGCIAVGALLHYFILCAWMCFIVETAHLLITTFFIFYKPSYVYFTMASVICWGAPIILIFVGEAVSHESYINEINGYCFIDNLIMVITLVIVPIGLILLLNLFIITAVVIKVLVYNRKRNQISPSVYSKQATFIVAVAIIGLMIIFIAAIVFIIVFFTVAQTLVYEVLFAISCIVFGLYAFVFHVLLSKDARDSWKECFKCSLWKKRNKIYSIKDNDKNEIIIVRSATPNNTEQRLTKQNETRHEYKNDKNKSNLTVLSDHNLDKSNAHAGERIEHTLSSQSIVSRHIVRLDQSLHTAVTIESDYGTINNMVTKETKEERYVTQWPSK